MQSLMLLMLGVTRLVKIKPIGRVMYGRPGGSLGYLLVPMAQR
jgi:hypothetical protein